VKFIALLAAAWLLAGCATVVLPCADSPVTPQDADAAWARVLQRFVDDDGEVDFAALAKDRADLDRVVRHVAVAPLDSGSSDERLAQMINAYNALSMWNVIDSGIPASHAGLAKLRFFVWRRFVIGGQAMSLYAFENDVIRPLARSAGEPRIHFALNCSAVSCPRLPREPFVGARLQAQLQRETLAFFARPDAYCVDESARTVWISELLDFYPQDFVPQAAPTLAAYAARFAPRPAPADFAVRFTPYDWTIADSARPRRDGASPCAAHQNAIVTIR
jgi:Protein of unknown function, DUF547